MAKTITVKDVKKIEKDGKKPFWRLTDTDGTEMTFFDTAWVEQATPGAKLDVEIDVSSKNGKTYINIKDLKVLQAGQPAAATTASPSPASPASQNGGGLTPEMIGQISNLFKTIICGVKDWKPDAPGKDVWEAKDARISRLSCLGHAVQSGASGDTAIVLAEHYFQFATRGKEYAEACLTRILKDGPALERSCQPMWNGSAAKMKDSGNGSKAAPTPVTPEASNWIPWSMEELHKDWTLFYKIADRLGFQRPSDVCKALSIKAVGDLQCSKEEALDQLSMKKGIDWRTGEVISGN